MPTLFDQTGKVAVITGFMRGISRADEIAGTAVLLASEAGSLATGQIFVIDGAYAISGP